MPPSSPYNFSFTSASSLIPETMTLAAEYQNSHDWDEVRAAVSSENLLLKVKKATMDRQYREIKKRLVLLTPAQLTALSEGSRDDARAIIFLAMLKSYAFLRDFVLEVIRTKFQVYDTGLTEKDYDRFFETKELAYPELTQLSPSTSRKIKQVTFRMLEETGLLKANGDYTILKPMVSQRVLPLILADDPKWLACFLMSDRELSEYQTNASHAKRT
ncbi:MAG: DUF1819 family protein [Saprospiraceae bacterium]|nr:DUF1819 family protein [Candidatus Opimibacter iunctus]